MIIMLFWWRHIVHFCQISHCTPRTCGYWVSAKVNSSPYDRNANTFTYYFGVFYLCFRAWGNTRPEWRSFRCQPQTLRRNWGGVVLLAWSRHDTWVSPSQAHIWANGALAVLSGRHSRSQLGLGLFLSTDCFYYRTAGFSSWASLWDATSHYTECKNFNKFNFLTCSTLLWPQT